MKFTQLFTKTLKEIPADEVSINSQLLIRGGFISKVMAGVYEYMPLGLRVLNKINNIIRDELDLIGGQELFMSVFQDKDVWQSSGRWSEAREVMYQFKDDANREYGLGFTHEEPLTATARRFISSYKDLPKAVYQIQTKFRNEARAKSGLLRGREFLMKDLYSFHASQDDLELFYEKTAGAYHRIFERVGVPAIRTFASGGLFSKYSDEFQAVAPIGEDVIYINEKEKRAINKEVYTDEVLADLQWRKDELIEKTAIEVGNIFKLGTKFSKALGLEFSDEAGQKHPVIMASYGIGPGRLMGTAVEISHDSKGIIWPSNIAPYQIHLVGLEGALVEADSVYQNLKNQGLEVIYDDRSDKSAGEKFADADLIGCPIRVLVSKKTINQGSGETAVEVKKRGDEHVEVMPVSSLIQLIKIK